MAGVRKFFGGVVSGALVSAVTLVVASQLSAPGAPEKVPEAEVAAVNNAPTAAVAEIAVAPLGSDAVVPDVVPDVLSDVLPGATDAAAAETGAAVVAQPPIPKPVTKDAEAVDVAAAAAGANTVAPDVAPTADPTSAPEAIFAALPDTPPAPPQVDPPAQTLPSQSAVAPVPEAPVPEAPVPEAPVPEAPIPVAPVPAAPVPAAEAAGSLIAKLPVPLAAPAADGLPAAAELPPPPPLMETTEAVLNDPQPQTLPQNAAAPPDPDVQAPVAPAAVGTAEAVVPDAPVAPADRMIVVEPPLPASEPAPAQTAEAEVQDPPPATGDAPVTPIKPRVITANEGGLTERNAETADPQDDSNAAVLPEVELADAPPLERFAAEFENPEGKPLFGILLVDAGDATVNRQSVAALPFPVSIVIDPLSPEAAAHASLYRAGNKEVIMLASGIPAGATPADLEQTFQAHAAALPEAVAVVDSSVSAFQDDRPLATQIVPILAAQGRGLLTWDRGLNAADQVARREGLPSATIFRQIDAENESIPVMRRYLDRAAFQAAQNGTVIVIGTVRPETIAALLEWSIEGRSSTVALAPASAFLRKP